MSEQEDATNLKMKLLNVILVEHNDKRVACIALCNLFIQLLQKTGAKKAVFMREMESAWDFHAKH